MPYRNGPFKKRSVIFSGFNFCALSKTNNHLQNLHSGINLKTNVFLLNAVASDETKHWKLYLLFATLLKASHLHLLVCTSITFLFGSKRAQTYLFCFSETFAKHFPETKAFYLCCFLFAFFKINFVYIAFFALTHIILMPLAFAFTEIITNKKSVF